MISSDISTVTRHARTVAVLCAVVLLVVTATPLTGALISSEGEHGGVASAQAGTSGEADIPVSVSGEDDSGGDNASDETTEAEEDAAAAEEERQETVAGNDAGTSGGVGGGAGTTSNQTAEDAASAETQRQDTVANNTNNQSGVGGNAGGNDDESGVGFVAERLLGMIEGLTTQASNEFGGLVSTMLELAVSRSAPGVADDPSTWSNPEDPMWQGAVDITELTRFMGGFIVAGGFIFSAMSYWSSPRAAKDRLKWCLLASVYLANPTFWNGLTLHASNTLSTTIAPGPEAFSTPDGILLVGLSVIAAGLLASASIWIIAVATFVTVVAHSAGYVTTMFLPLAVSLYVMPMYLRSLGEMVVYLHGVTIFMPIFQSISTLGITRMSLAESGVLGSLTGVVMFLGVVYMVFYLFQKEVLEKAFDAPITSLGVHGAQMSVDGARNAKNSVANAPQAYRDMRANIEGKIEGARSTFGGSDGGFSRPEIGVLQTQSVSRQSAAVADGGSDATRRGVDAKSSPFPKGPDGRFQSIDIAENRERDRLSHGDY